MSVSFETIEAVNSHERQMTSIGVKRVYIKMAGGWVAGAILARIRYFESPTKDGSKTRRAGIKRGDHLWIVRTREDWQTDLYMTAAEFDAGLRALKDKGLVAVETHFHGKAKANRESDQDKPTKKLFIRTDPDAFLSQYNAALNAPDTKPTDADMRRSKSANANLQVNPQSQTYSKVNPQSPTYTPSKSAIADDKSSSYSSVLTDSVGSASDANAPTPPPPAQPSKPSRSKGTRKRTPVLPEGEAGPPPSPPATPEQAAANDAAFDALEAAPPEARQPSRARGASKDAIERAIGDVCFRGDKDLRRANMGVIRAVGKDIRAMNADLETPITAELIYLVFEDSGYWQRHYMSLDETTNTRRLPTPGIVGKHTLNILAWGKGQTQAPPPPLIRYTAPSPEPIFRRRTPAELEALRRQALDTLPEANYVRTA
jgi:hypothetical protein